MSRPWMPLYVADYLADTGHLSAAEHGAYLLLIMHYWANGGLPDDDRKLSRIARMDASAWTDARETLAEFFSDGWRHERIEKELASAAASYERRANAGRKGGSSKAKQDDEQCFSNASALPEQSQPQPQSEFLLRKNKTRVRGFSAPAPARIEFSLGMEITPDCRLVGEAYCDPDAVDDEWRRFVTKKTAQGAHVPSAAALVAAFAGWCEDIGKYGPAAKAPAKTGRKASVSMFRVDQHSAAGEAWEVYLRSQGKRGVPWKDGRWSFPSEWPPGAGPPVDAISSPSPAPRSFHEAAE